jgi:hypothetical protein
VNRTPFAVQMPFEDHDLVSQGEDSGLLVAVAHRQQPQQSERVGYAEVGQSQQHDRTSSRRARQRSPSQSNRWHPPQPSTTRVKGRWP